jgi:hypothetical protein
MAFVPFTGTKRKGAQPVCAALKACAILFFFMLAGKAGAKRQRREKYGYGAQAPSLNKFSLSDLPL